ncbi:hypothetical protein [Endozoicomonas euniceicola]|uniref:Uncharacterized protein n=1 Tax=Endozoicomonas euniceicola TaxID=1234143 RepID=A0ABY6GZM7_9GAMM|nr:hypothetical protein [Endozoicomonas euniceicola]UYM18263.1 hypothetical protein NX720_10270 [Endozoicomonas euniceicola]
MKFRFLLFFSALFSSSYLSAYNSEELRYNFGISTNGQRLQLPADFFIDKFDVAGNRGGELCAKLVVRSRLDGYFYGLDLTIHNTQQQQQYSLEINEQIYFITIPIPQQPTYPIPYTQLINTPTPSLVQAYPTTYDRRIAVLQNPSVTPFTPHGQNPQQQEAKRPSSSSSAEDYRQQLLNEQNRVAELIRELKNQDKKVDELTKQNSEQAKASNNLSSQIENYRQQAQNDQKDIAKLNRQLGQTSAKLENQNKKVDELTKKNSEQAKASNNLSSQIKNYRQQAQNDQEKIAKLNRQLTQTSATLENQDKKVDELTKQNNEQAKENNNLFSQIENYHQQAQNDQKKIAKLNRQLDRTSTTLEDQNKKVDELTTQNNALAEKNNAYLRELQLLHQASEQASQATLNDSFPQIPGNQAEAVVSSAQITPDESEQSKESQDDEQQSTTKETIIPIQDQSNSNEVLSNLEKNTIVQQNTKKNRNKKKKKKKTESSLPEQPEQPEEQHLSRKKIKFEEFKRQINKIKLAIKCNLKKGNLIAKTPDSQYREFLKNSVNYENPEKTAHYIRKELEKAIREIFVRNPLRVNPAPQPQSSSSEPTTAQVINSEIYYNDDAEILFSEQIKLWLKLIGQFPTLMQTGSPLIFILGDNNVPPSFHFTNMLSEEALSNSTTDIDTSLFLAKFHRLFKMHNPHLKIILLAHTFDFGTNPDAIFAFVWAVLVAHVMNDDELIGHLLSLFPDNYNELLETYISSNNVNEQRLWLTFNIAFIQRIAYIRLNNFLTFHISRGQSPDPDILAQRRSQARQLQRLINPILDRTTENEGAYAPNPLRQLQLIRPDNELNRHWENDYDLVHALFESLPLQNETEDSLLPALIMELHNINDPVNPVHLESATMQLIRELRFNYEIFDHLFDLLATHERVENDVLPEDDQSEEQPIPTTANAFLQMSLSGVNKPGIQRLLTFLNEQGLAPENITVNQMAEHIHMFSDKSYEAEEQPAKSIFSYLKLLACYLNRPIVLIYSSSKPNGNRYEAYSISTDQEQHLPSGIANQADLLEYIHSGSPLILGYEWLSTTNRYRWLRLTPQEQAVLTPVPQHHQPNSTTDSGYDPDQGGTGSSSPSDSNSFPIVIHQTWF